jgi:hypothetical protein
MAHAKMSYHNERQAHGQFFSKEPQLSIRIRLDYLIVVDKNR